MKKTIIKKTCVLSLSFLILFFLSTCDDATLIGGLGGGGGSLNPGVNARTLIGAVESVPNTSNSTQKVCVADTITATDSKNNVLSATIETDCTFSIDLKLETAYVIGFSQNGTFLVDLLFGSGITRFSTSTLPVFEDSTSIIDLGTITISGSIATTLNNPLAQVDQDGDGINNLADDDDDNDDIPDEKELDCDYDGFINDVDLNDNNAICSQAVGVNLERIYEVKPRNNLDASLASDDDVELDRDIRFRSGCQVNPSTVNSTNFRVTTGGANVQCEYDLIDLPHSQQQIRCRHPDFDLLPDRVYTASISGLTCENAQAIQSVTWTFRTKSGNEILGGVNEDDFDELAVF